MTLKIGPPAVIYSKYFHCRYCYFQKLVYSLILILHPTNFGTVVVLSENPKILCYNTVINILQVTVYKYLFLD